ncbi:MAG: RusA family crossover junction endodeoxyribonuclease [bacterium]|nr:RusA family crossover junction endodeoxyribonuclease [bacterium]
MDDTKHWNDKKKQKSELADICLVLPLPPSINQQYATVNGRRILSRNSRIYKQHVAEEVTQWLASQPDSETTEKLFRNHYLSLSITFYFTTALRRDLDGGLKIAQDALCEALGVNDNRIIEIHLRKSVDRNCPRSEISLIAIRTDKTDLYEEGGKGLTPLRTATTHKRRVSRRKRRSFEELARRYDWK